MNTIKPQELKPNELRIGNIVKGIYITEEYNEETDNYEDKEIEILCRVLGVDSTGAYDWPIVLEALNKDDFKYDITEYDKVVGIELTEEILLRCGFEETYRSHYRVKYDSPNETIGFDFDFIVPDSSMRGFRYYGRWIDGIIYLHQLQNLFYSLTGEELTLKDHA